MARRYQVRMKRRGLGGGAKTVAFAGAALSGALAADQADAVPIYNNPDDVRLSPGQGSININLSNILNPNPTLNNPDARGYGTPGGAERSPEGRRPWPRSLPKNGARPSTPVVADGVEGTLSQLLRSRARR